ncbi:DNA polymerase I [Bacillus horti]|uniref:DNA polymerase I n=1 Tax=Caldalkalibacillus horti TaxID=77523 RepID=A0ABT9VTI2_9BACI|nr:DNA polymerase I [Bacillus horti]MDQ0164162.1 DNA polymerase-1 [Bacillus horti]
MSNKLIIMDGNSIAFRAFYALPLLNNDKGVYTNAIYGFTTILLKIIEEEQPTHLLVAFDAGKVTFRHKDFKEYKGKRQKTPSELSEQFPLIRKLLDSFSIKHFELEGYEADDIIGTMTKEADQEKWSTKVYTGDKDMLQLVSDHVHVALTRKGISEVEYYDLDKLDEKYQLKPEQIIDLKGLMGDTSDNIPGVPGVGEKTALKLLHQYETVEKVYEHIEEVTAKKLKENLVNYRDDAFLSKALATIERGAPIELKLEDTVYEGYDKEKVVPFFKEMAFGSLLERVGAEVAELKEEDMEEIVVQTLTVDDQELLKQALISPSALHAEVTEENYHKSPVLGLSIRNKNGLFFVSNPTVQESKDIQQWLKDRGQEKWIYDAKRAEVALSWLGIELEGVHFDTYLAAYLLDPSDSDYTADSIAKKYTGLTISSDEQVYGKGAKRTLPNPEEELEEQVIQHIARKADSIYIVKEKLEEKLEEAELSSLFFELEQPLGRVLAKMELEGVKVERKTLDDMGEELASRLDELTKDIYELAGTEFNINSPKQLGEILFDKLQLPVIKKTKTGYSTNAEVLEKLEPQHEIVGNILHYRQLGKIQSTYIEGLKKVIMAKTSKVHTMFQQTIAATGRLSSIDPNLQNIPIRLEEGRKLRKAFVPAQEGCVLLAADYSQIELRVLAHISEDEGLIEAFKEDKDIHTKTAMDVFHVEEKDVTSLMRRHAKAVNFGIVYGISDYGLSQSLNITRKEAASFIERYFESFPGVKKFMEDVVKQAKKDGYVTTLLHRRRYLPEINSSNFNLRSFAERTAMNTPIQGTAADIIKKAMIDMALKLEEKKLASKLLLQVHDELIFEVPKNEIDIMTKLVPEVMEAAVQLNVPLKVDVDYGDSWYDAK